MITTDVNNMKFLNFSFAVLSKFKRNYVIFSSAKNAPFRHKNNVLHTAFISLFYSPCRAFSLSCVSLCKTNSISDSGKRFQEKENEYAHLIMEKSQAYSGSLLKYPLQNDNCTAKAETLSGHLNVADIFAQVTLHNLLEGLTVEDIKFRDIVEKVCLYLPEASDENIKKILHYLCMWPPTSATDTPNFKALWNLLDEECVKRMERWDELFHRKFSKMSQKNNHLVFVYGTLKKGEPNHDLIEKRTEGMALFLGKAKTVKKWPLVIASRYNIPYLLYSEGNGMHVVGEVYEVDDIMLAKLDELECHPEYYTRLVEEVHTIPEEGKILKPWIYFLKNFRSELLKLPFLTEYQSKGSHGLEYVSSEDTSNPEDVYT